ncbi:hypothetical protein [uncultured Winogradskyella sp.]|uniref:hypothetical protein n=1 Tax=Winogradskyella sp. 4-2091 TaxID=3381659 RepID=UPI00262F303A|nr:hypothetical protein [uncultured Winogradskyella sp.]
MKTHQLSFGQITILKSNLAEVIINSGMLMDMEMIEEYHSFLLTHLEAPFSLLINKVHAYTYTFEAQKKIANLKEIQAMAVVVKGYVGKKSTEFLIAFNDSNDWNISTFRTREEALIWLENQD